MGFIKFKFEEEEPEEPLFGTGDNEDRLEHMKVDKAFARSGDKDDDFVLDWEKRLGFSKNPFLNEILSPIEKFISGYKGEKEKLNLFVIEKKHFGTICAPNGYGKSTILCWLAKQLKKHSKKVIVISLKGKNLQEGRGFLNILLDPFTSIFQIGTKKAHLSMTTEEVISLIKRKLGKKSLILLVDDFESISKQNLDLLNSLIPSLAISIICAGSDEKIDKFKSKCENDEKGIAHHFKDHLNLKLHGLSIADMRKMIQKRVEFFGGVGIEPFNDTYLRQIYTKIDKSPSRMLKLCNEHAIELSVNLDKMQCLKDESDKRKAMIYASEEFEHADEGKHNTEYDTIEIIKN